MIKINPENDTDFFSLCLQNFFSKKVFVFKKSKKNFIGYGYFSKEVRNKMFTSFSSHSLDSSL